MHPIACLWGGRETRDQVWFFMTAWNSESIAPSHLGSWSAYLWWEGSTSVRCRDGNNLFGLTIPCLALVVIEWILEGGTHGRHAERGESMCSVGEVDGAGLGEEAVVLNATLDVTSEREEVKCVSGVVCKVKGDGDRSWDEPGDKGESERSRYLGERVGAVISLGLPKVADSNLSARYDVGVGVLDVGILVVKTKGK